ncbi:MAG TPA: type II toxin-antitoxin system VapC family toxin [Candidatus Dormibacteraeota bacterium]
MSVVDASVLVDALVDGGAAGNAARNALRTLHAIEVPALFGAEAVSVLRRRVARGELDPRRAAVALNQIRGVRAIRYPFEPFAQRAWELRGNLTVYDAWYVALAEWLGTDLITADQTLLRAAGPRCPVRRPGEHA